MLSTPVFGDLDKTQILTLTNGWGDGLATTEGLLHQPASVVQLRHKRR
jgi:hypothetical protein